MSLQRKYLFALSAVLLLAGAAAAESRGWQAVPFQHVRIDDAFWGPRLRVNRTATIEANLHQCEITGRIDNFAIAGKLKVGKHKGELYNDSDVYKVLEGIAYTLTLERDAGLEKRTDAIIDQIAAAQQADGYLNTYFTLVKPTERWRNIQHGHELYCAGHLIEAAVAYHQATGKRKFLDVAIRLADHIGTVFGPGKRFETCGHEEIELALVKLHRATGKKAYLEQAKFFLDARGQSDGRKPFGEYAQDHKPIREQREVTGHAVRAMYLYCGMADVAALTDDAGLRGALEQIWRDVTERKMYLTGGIGPSAHNEGFTVPYDLPNDSAYAETCAAIGMALWNHRMFLMSGAGKYADVLEREVYNGLLSGVSLGGERFFYVNPLGSVGKHHRVPWFDCSCCPTNLVRFLPALGERVYAQRDNTVRTELYLGNSAAIQLKDGKVRLTQRTKYPWAESIEIAVEPEKPFTFAIELRIPGWCKGAEVAVNGSALKSAPATDGYVRLAREWQAGDTIQLRLPMPVERVHADPRVKADVGRVALQRGPVVYCLEGVDNGGQSRDLVLPADPKPTMVFKKELLGGVVVVRGEAQRVAIGADGKRTSKPVTFTAVPYFAWDNRAPGPMVVWLPEKPELVEVAGEAGMDSHGVRVTASHVWQGDTLADLNDGATPKGSGDQALRRMTWWDHRGGTEWLAYRYPEARKLASVSVYWFDDTGVGRCRLPASWRLLWLDGKEWKPVQLLPKQVYGMARDAFNAVHFEPVTTRELRLEVKLQDDFSGGVLKFVAD